MGLFDQVVGALDNPNQQASTDQIGSILGAVQQLAGSQDTSTDNMQTLMSIVGQYARTSLQQTSQTAGRGQAEELVDQFAGTGPSVDAMQALFSPQQREQVADAAAQRTGLSRDTILSLLPIVVPIVLKLLQTGSSKTGVSRQNQPNSVLNVFLDSDSDGDVDMGDAIAMAGRFLKNR
ncbi:MAG: DUF937 domain-containing protein [Cyanobacteria bacterium P01_A01_bin.135]